MNKTYMLAAALALTAALLLSLPLAAGAEETQDLRTTLVNLCLSDGETQACCDCGVDLLMEGMDEEQLSAMAELIQIGMEISETTDGAGVTEEQIARMEELQSKLDQERLSTLDSQIEAECGNYCTRQ